VKAFGSTGIRRERSFDVNDHCFLDPFHVDHDVKVGGKAYPHVHFCTGGSSTQPVKWEMQIMRARREHDGEYGNFDSPFSVFVTLTPTGTAYDHLVAEVVDGDAMTLTEPDELILVTLKRVTNGGTDNPNDVFALTVDLHYETERYASVAKAYPYYS
jgi:hypothetical protein